MALTSNAFNVVVGSPPATVLAQAIAGMTAGSWVQLSEASNMGTALAQSGSVICTQSNDCGWDPTSRNIGGVTGPSAHFQGKRSSSYPYVHVAYREQNHSWYVVNSNVSAFGTTGHGGDGNILNPATGVLYHRPYNDNTVYQASPTEYSWSTLSSFGTYVQVFEGNCFWSGSMTGSAGSGAIVCWNSGNNRIQIYDLGNASWFPYISVSGSSNVYHSVASYSAVHNCAVFGGGNSPDNVHWWRLNADRTVTAMPNSPFGVATDTGGNEGRIVCDPVSGTFIAIHESGAIAKLDPTGSGTWTTLGGGHSPPDPFIYSNANHAFCWAVPADANHAFGVMVWACTDGTASTTKMFVYRHQ
jgi:hypothetical protein